MGQLPDRLARLLLAAYGTLPEHLIRVDWSCIHENKKYPHLELYSLKGNPKTLKRKRIDYIAPLNDIAINELKELRHLTSQVCKYPFPAKTGGRKFVHDEHISHDSFTKVTHQFNSFCEDNYGIPNISFTFGRIRTSVSTRLHEAKVSKEINTELLFHEKSGTSKKHYDRWEFKQEKLIAARKWGYYLNNIISKPYSQITDRLPDYSIPYAVDDQGSRPGT